jgi:hypothetical protein
MLCYLDDKTSVATQSKWTHIRQTAPASKTPGMREATTDGRRNRGPHGEPATQGRHTTLNHRCGSIYQPCCNRVTTNFGNEVPG